jgi:hypothetical protein
MLSSAHGAQLRRLLTCHDCVEHTAVLCNAAFMGTPHTLYVATVAASFHAAALLCRHVHVGLPDEAGRLSILGVHMRKVRAGPDVDLYSVARQVRDVHSCRADERCAVTYVGVGHRWRC